MAKVFNKVEKINMIAFPMVIKVKDVVKGYVNNSESEEGGVTSMNGMLNIRPRYQRAYIHDGDKSGWRENLINSILSKFPINKIYLGIEKGAYSAKQNENVKEVLDGQQRIITICDFYNGKFSIDIDGDPYYFHNLDPEMRETFLNYDLDITICVGEENERIKWFKRINQPNAILTQQEIRNSVYVGPFVEAAKKYFSAVTSRSKNKIVRPDYEYSITPYSNGLQIERCDILELVLDWISYAKYPELKKDADTRICLYMAEHQNDDNCDELIAYYKEVIDWIKKTFKVYQKCMTKVEWGRLYAEYGKNEYNLDYINSRVDALMGDFEVTAYSRVFEYVLMGEPLEKCNMLVLRNFQTRDKDAQAKRQHNYDPISKKPLGFEGMTTHAHHIIPWCYGGKTEIDNLIVINEDTHKKIHTLGTYTPEKIKEILNDFLMTYK